MLFYCLDCNILCWNSICGPRNFFLSSKNHSKASIETDIIYHFLKGTSLKHKSQLHVENIFCSQSTFLKTKYYLLLKLGGFLKFK